MKQELLHIQNKFSKLYLLILFICFYPTVSSAFALEGASFQGIICYLVSLVNAVIPILVALAFVFFFWGLSKYVINSSGNEKELQVGKNYMMWGVIALFVLTTFRAIIGIVTNEFEFGKATVYPFLPGSTSVCGVNAVQKEVTSIN